MTLISYKKFYCSSSVKVFNSVNFKNVKPIIPAISEEIRITNLALLIIASSSKANKVIKIDIVKPIPAKKPTPIIDFQFRSTGNLHRPKATVKIPT